MSMGIGPDGGWVTTRFRKTNSTQPPSNAFLIARARRLALRLLLLHFLARRNHSFSEFVTRQHQTFCSQCPRADDIHVLVKILIKPLFRHAQPQLRLGKKTSYELVHLLIQLVRSNRSVDKPDSASFAVHCLLVSRNSLARPSARAATLAPVPSGQRPWRPRACRSKTARLR